MRTYKAIYQSYTKWIVEKTGDETLSYDSLIEKHGEQSAHVFLYKEILDKCYDREMGMFYFCKFIIGDLLDIGYPKPFRYNGLLHKWHKNVLSTKYLSVLCARGHGKEIADSTLILTTSGWKTHGELVIGDKVYHSSGKPVSVLWTADKHIDDYIVKTRNGESIRCHADHEWTVFDAKSRTTKTLETKEMFNNTKWLNTRSRFFLPNIKPLDFEKKNLPINPYYLGLWLGDGCSINTTITHTKEDTKSVNSVPYKISNQWTHKDTGVITTSFAHNDILTELQELTLINNKHIPDIYKNSSIEQRLELVAGLIDSDGSVSKNSNKIRFTNTNKEIIDGVVDVLVSLGLRPYVTTQLPKKGHLLNGKLIKGNKKVYTVGFVTNIDIPTKLPRKKIKTVILNRISIKDIKYEPNGETGNCITVDSDDGIYLVGKNLIPTHNSVYFSQILEIYDMFLFPFRRVILISASQEQANKLLEYMKDIIENNEWLLSKKDPTRWAETRIIYNKGYIMTAGIGSEILGQHVDRIVIDDILRSDNKLSDNQIEDYIDMNLSPMLLNRDGQMILVGTPKSDSDIFSEIKRRISTEPKTPWVLVEFPAILDYEKKILQCPDRFTWDKIMEKRLTMGPLKFAREYQLEFFSRDQSLFPTKIVAAAKRRGVDMHLLDKDDKRGKEWSYIMGVDVARSGSVSADFTVAIVLAYNSVTQDKQIVHMWREKGLKISEQSRHIAELASKFNNCQVLVEQNNIGIDMIDTLADDYNVGVESFITGSKGQKKDELIRFLITAFEHEQIIMPQGDEWSRDQMSLMEGELTKFCVQLTPAGNEQFKGMGSHDDIVMSLALANKATQTLGVPFAVSNFGDGSGTTRDTNPMGGLISNDRDETDLVKLIRMGVIK